MLDTKNNKLANEDSKKKERHIVSWSQQEDDILREQISLHGTENWAIIASKFKDKTTRQCRRRWYTYLNSDFKKGGWSPEEDLLLCEAQKIFGNRWTEIAKVVSGRTDNAVKNRFTTLCKKRAKCEALAKENSSSFINQNNKRVLFQNGSNEGSSETAQPVKRMRRAHILDITEGCSLEDGTKERCKTTVDQQLRAPFAVLIDNVHGVDNLPAQYPSTNAKENLDNAQGNKSQGTFIKKDDPKVTALTQQAELLTSLALKVNTENTDQSLENAWKILQDFLSRSKEHDILKYATPDIELHLEDIKDLVEDLRSSNDGSLWRQPNLHESPGSSEYSTGSTLLSHAAGEKIDQSQSEIGTHHQEVKSGSTCAGKQNGFVKCEKEIPKTVLERAEAFKCCKERKNNTMASAFSSPEFSSPMNVIPLFRSLAAGIPSPQFSESERSFLLKTLGMESPSLNPSANPSQPPPCKRALLQSL